MKKTILVITAYLIIMMPIVLCAQTESTKENKKAWDPLRDPFKDVQTAVADAMKSNKRIILDVGGDWCYWCVTFTNFIEKNADIKNFLQENFIMVKVNYSEENKNEKFLSQFPKVGGYPHLYVLNKKGKMLHSQFTGLFQTEKSFDKKKFMTFLKKWSTNKS